MAEPSKPKRPRSTPAKAKPKAVEDAVVVEEAAGADAPGAQDAGDITAGKAAEALEDAVGQSDDTPAPDDDPDNAPVETPVEPAVETVHEAPVIAPTPVTEPERRSGFFPVVLGGVVAAGLGAGALYLAQDRGWVSLGGTEELQDAIVQQDGEIAVLKAALSETSTRIKALEQAQLDGVAIDAALGALKGDGDAIKAETAAMAETLAALRAQIESVETQPIPKAELPAEVVAAYEARLADMMGTVDTRFVAMQAALDARLAEIAAAQTAAAQSEAEAMRAAEVAAARAAMARVEIALDSGAGFAGDAQVVADKAGVEIPAALSAVAAEGAPTLAALQGTFPDVARAALTAATREAADDGSVSPLTAFLRTQLGARSLEPREGDDPDAVLSRAEAAVRNGDLDAALAEIAALPQVGQDALATWVAQAETRRAALAAAADLSAQLNN